MHEVRRLYRTHLKIGVRALSDWGGGGEGKGKGERLPYCPKKITQCPEASVVQTHSNRSNNKNVHNSHV